MKSEEKDNLQKAFDKFRENNSMKLSENFDKSFEKMLAKEEKRKHTIFFKPVFKYAIATILLIIISLLYFTNKQRTLYNSPKFISEKTDSSKIKDRDTTVITNKNKIKETVELPENLLASNYDPINFENNPILEGYYGQMRTNLSCKITNPKHGKIFDFKKDGVKITFSGSIENKKEKNLELVIKIYLGANQKPQIRKKILLSDNNHFAFSEKFIVPGQYSWKIVANSEIIFAGNFFIGKISAK